MMMNRAAIWTVVVAVSVLGPSAVCAAEVVSFNRDVVPVLTKLGCNAGSCHGSFQGRGGFRLSLLGFDPLADFEALTREARGRRVFPAAPEQSLILTKPTMQVPHGGKRRLTAESESYRLLRDWIAQGMRAPGAGTPSVEGPRVLRLEVTPSEIVLAPGKTSTLQVRAVWSDGAVQDAARWVLYESTADTVAEIGPVGQVKAVGPGRAAITIRYLGQVAAVPVTVPYIQEPATVAVARSNFIDDLVADEWKKLGLKPAMPASDAEFLRRVHLDLIGTLPTLDEIQRFHASKDPAKRSKLIDELLERPEYVDYWALKWGDLLRAHRRALGDKGLMSFNGWLRQSLRENRPVQRLVRELLTSQGNLYTTGPAAFFYIDRTPADLAETTAQIFLGIRLQCAKCHHHPFEALSQDDYYGMAAFFANVQRKDTGENGTFGGAQSVKLVKQAAIVNPATGKPALPRWFGQTETRADSVDPRGDLADWITSKDNPYFARNIVNRYWGYLFGRGLVEPIDDLRATNPSSHPALLQALARDWVDHGQDLKHLLRTLCNTRAYQLASEIAPERDRDGMFFTHRKPRRLPAEVLLDALHQAAGTEEAFDNLPPGTRAISLPDPAVTSYFLDTFGRPRRTNTCECERDSRADLAQVLHLVNSEFVHRIATDPKGRLARLLAAKKSDAEVLDELYLCSFCRLPSDKERASALRLIAAAPTRQEGYEDIFWALLNCGEFLFNH